MIFWGVNGGQWNSTGYEDHWDFFRPEGDELGANTNAYFPRPIMDSKQNQQVQSRYLQDASYIRLKNLQIGYTIPKYLTKRSALKNYEYSFLAIICGLELKSTRTLTRKPYGRMV